MRFFSLKVISEGDKITEIEPASEDWWQGTNPHGNILFPGKSSLFLYVLFLE